jgi:hypothetical protein
MTEAHFDETPQDSEDGHEVRRDPGHGPNASSEPMADDLGINPQEQPGIPDEPTGPAEGGD